MPQPLDLTVITPTTGKPSLDGLVASIDAQPPRDTRLAESFFGDGQPLPQELDDFDIQIKEVAQDSL